MRRLIEAFRGLFTALHGFPVWPPRRAWRAIRQRPTGGTIPEPRPFLTPVILSPGRSTTLRPGETHAEAMNRLTEGRDL